ncbi:MAG: peptidase U32 family protein [Bacillota bacterium]
MKRAVKIKAPANSLNSAKEQIQAGADEIYLGLFSPDWFTNLSFSHRGRSNLKTDTNGCIEGPEELKEIVDYAHGKGVSVSYTANLFNLPDTCIHEKNKKDLTGGYLDYVKMGIDCGVDSVIVANLNEILHIREAGIDIPIVASCLFMVSNEHYYHMLRSLGVTAFFLPHDTNFTEMKKMVELSRAENENIEIGLFGHLSCAMLSGGCHWYHKFGEEIDLGYPCRNKYLVTSKDGKQEEVPFFDFTFDCSICQLEKIIKVGVNSIKMVGRSSSARLNSRITKIYCQTIDRLLEGEDIMEIRRDLIKREPWWEIMYCKNNKCKYSENSIYADYIIG